MKIERILKPDKYNLDRDWEDQPILVYEYGKKTNKAREYAEALKRKAELRRSKMFLDMKENPENFGLEKSTDTAVNAAIERHPDYQNCLDLWVDAKREYEEMKIILEALRHRRAALESLTQLYAAQYFARKPREKRNSEAEEIEKAAVRAKGRIRARKA